MGRNLFNPKTTMSTTTISEIHSMETERKERKENGGEDSIKGKLYH